MSSLPARLVLYVVAPAVVGGAVAWGMRSTAGGFLTDGVVGSRGPKVSSLAGVGGEKRSGTATGESALSEQRRFCDRLRGASFDQLTELLTEAQGFADAFRRRSAREMVFEQMARTDPARAWAFLENWESGGSRSNFLNAWGRVDVAGALTWADGQGEAAIRHFRDILDGLVPDDVEGFAAILPRLKPEQVHEGQLATAFRVLAAEDSARALKLLDGLASGTARNAAASSVAEGWARGNPEAAYAWAKDLTDPAQRESALRGVFRAWAESDPQRVAAKLDELSKEEPRDEKGELLSRGERPIRAIVRAWAALDPKAAAAWLRDQPERNSDDFKQLFASEILRSRESWPAAELADMVRRPGEKLVTDQKDRLYNSAMSWGDNSGGTYLLIGEYGGFHSPLGMNENPGENQALRIDDPAKSFDDLSRQPADATRQHVLQEVASQWVAKDPQAALAKLRETTDEFLKLGLLNAFSNVARQTRDPVLAAEVAKAFPENSMGREKDSDVYQSIAQHDPERAQALLAGDLEATKKASLASALAADHASYDPQGALAWAAGQPDEALQSAATRSAVSRWAGADAYAVSEWLTTQPAGPLREAAVQSLVVALGESSPEDAIAWAGSLVDPKVREVEQMNLVQRQINRDPARARQLAEQIPFSDEMRRQIVLRIEAQEKHP